MPDARLLKGVFVEGPGGKLAFVAYFYRKGEFMGCLARVDTEEGWRRLLEGLDTLQPAEPFDMRQLGFAEGLHFGGPGKKGTVLWMKGFFWRGLERRLTLAEFETYNASCKTAYLTEYCGKGLWEVEPGKWHYAEQPRCKGHRPKRVVM